LRSGANQSKALPMMPFSPKPLTTSSQRPHGLSRQHRITLGGLTFVPDLSGALLAPDAKTLLVADLHLEQGAALARRGIAVPPYDTLETLALLERVLADSQATRLVMLGDSFHDAIGHLHMADDVRARLARLTHAVDTVWITGNHDPDVKDGLGGQHCASLALGPITLRHEPRVLSGDELEIAGHLHPGCGIVQRGALVRAKCFVHDARRIILPAFGAYAGGMSVRAPAFKGLLNEKGAAVHMLARNALHAFPLSRVV
jgi:uncharacterized protein